ncbi:PTPLA-domain-containing protein [Wolfiporia cocos MD-104 SS10]|uniref:Very-long-chain (3R)-3-hydroxyacyl-CoA dehydratase n=1 Tax=Wolfiporia cocos (strain MD-104) TaxID=742152 RepID=A0A2H3J8P2_WOLCO|nr:PTPLA-domain-containing protein [Wolfiporia cocos MD-104 SS10]
MAQAKRSPKPSRTPPKRGPSALVRYYLVAYNVLSALGWAYVLALTAAHLLDIDASAQTVQPPRLSAYLPPALARHLPAVPRFASSAHRLERRLPAALVPLFRRACTAHDAVGPQTAFVQTFAVLEVLHALCGWVRSPLATTAAQVASRLYLVWGVTALFGQTRTHPLYASMVLSWALTEVVRYAFYACTLLGREPRALLWLRYTLFFVLYPTGAGSEAGLIYASLPAPPPSIPFLSAGWYRWALPLTWPFSTPRWVEALHDDFRAVMFLIWWPGLYVMYTYMMKQRRKVLGAGPGRTLGAKPKTL